jgi:hypothetical protein
MISRLLLAATYLFAFNFVVGATSVSVESCELFSYHAARGHRFQATDSRVHVERY